MPLLVHNVTFDSTGDPYDLAVWWGQLMERPLAAEHGVTGGPTVPTPPPA